MRFLIDECVGPAVAAQLKESGYDVYSVFEKNRGASDKEVLELAFRDGRILITSDKDFGEIIYKQQIEHAGVILLRLSNEKTANKINALKSLLSSYRERLSGNFVVVTDNEVRFSR